MKYLMLIALLFVCSCATSFGTSKEEERAQILYKQGTHNLVIGNFTQALKILLEANKLSPKNSGIQNNLGMAYYFKKDINKAMSYIKSSIELDNTNSDAKSNLASIYMEQGKSKDAIAIYKEILKDLIYDKQYKTYYNMGLLSLKLNENSKATGYFQKSIEENKDYCPSHFQLGLISYKGGFYKDSIKSFINASKGVCFENPAPHYYQGLSYFESGIQDHAKAKFDHVVEKHGNSKYATLSQLKLTTLKQTKIPDRLLEASNKREFSTKIKERTPEF